MSTDRESLFHSRWLIERGQPEGLNNAEWLTPFGTWTRDARQAVKFASESDARFAKMGKPPARAVMHEFAGPLPPEAFRHVAPLRTASVSYKDGVLTVEREDKS